MNKLEIYSSVTFQLLTTYCIAKNTAYKNSNDLCNALTKMSKLISGSTKSTSFDSGIHNPHNPDGITLLFNGKVIPKPLIQKIESAVINYNR